MGSGLALFLIGVSPDDLFQLLFSRGRQRSFRRNFDNVLGADAMFAFPSRKYSQDGVPCRFGVIKRRCITAKADTRAGHTSSSKPTRIQLRFQTFLFHSTRTADYRRSFRLLGNGRIGHNYQFRSQKFDADSDYRPTLVPTARLTVRRHTMPCLPCCSELFLVQTKGRQPYR